MTKPLQNISWAGDFLANNVLTTVGIQPMPPPTGEFTDTKADQFWAAYGVQGAGIKVANIDTGVQWNHPALDQSAMPVQVTQVMPIAGLIPVTSVVALPATIMVMARIPWVPWLPTMIQV